VVFVIADDRGLNAVVIQKFARLPRVLTGDQVSLAQNADRAVGDVLQVADRSGYDVEDAFLLGLRHIDSGESIADAIKNFETRRKGGAEEVFSEIRIAGRSTDTRDPYHLSR